MKTIPFAVSPRVLPMSDDSEHRTRTLWFADGRSMPAQVTKVEKDGLRVTSMGAAEFISATELCTVDRVHFGFGTRKESAWVARVAANEARRAETPVPGK